jgi:hypothetical protein
MQVSDGFETMLLMASCLRALHVPILRNQAAANEPDSTF